LFAYNCFFSRIAVDRPDVDFEDHSSLRACMNPANTFMLWQHLWQVAFLQWQCGWFKKKKNYWNSILQTK